MSSPHRDPFARKAAQSGLSSWNVTPEATRGRTEVRALLPVGAASAAQTAPASGAFRRSTLVRRKVSVQAPQPADFAAGFGGIQHSASAAASAEDVVSDVFIRKAASMEALKLRMPVRRRRRMSQEARQMIRDQLDIELEEAWGNPELKKQVECILRTRRLGAPLVPMVKVEDVAGELLVRMEVLDEPCPKHPQTVATQAIFRKGLFKASSAPAYRNRRPPSLSVPAPSLQQLRHSIVAELGSPNLEDVQKNAPALEALRNLF